MCAFISNEDRVKNASPSEIVSYDTLCEITAITENVNKENITEVEQYTITVSIHCYVTQQAISVLMLIASRYWLWNLVITSLSNNGAL